MAKLRATLDGRRVRPSAYVSGVDVIGGDLTAEITGINSAFELPNTHVIAALLIRIDGVDRYMKINADNEDRLCQLFGQKASVWVKKRIVLYYDPEVKFKGGTVGGVRIRLDGKPQERPEPEAKASASLRKEMLTAIKSAADTDALETIGGGIKAAAAQLTSKDAAALRDAYRDRYDEIA